VQELEVEDTGRIESDADDHTADGALLVHAATEDTHNDGGKERDRHQPDHPVRQAGDLGVGQHHDVPVYGQLVLNIRGRPRVLDTAVAVIVL
jgi:hypothetical protein